MENQLEYYISQLSDDDESSIFLEDETKSFQQCAVYADKARPVKCHDKINVKFRCPDSGKRPDVVNTSSLWAMLTNFMDDTHSICNQSMRRCNVQFTTRALREYLSDKTIHAFLTGRRVYPLMELLDRPRTRFEKKHQTAVGFLFSFILDKKVSICDIEYNWSNKCTMSVGNIDINPEGFWFISKN